MKENDRTGFSQNRLHINHLGGLPDDLRLAIRRRASSIPAHTSRSRANLSGRSSWVVKLRMVEGGTMISSPRDLPYVLQRNSTTNPATNPPSKSTMADQLVSNVSWYCTLRMEGVLLSQPAKWLGAVRLSCLAFICTLIDTVRLHLLPFLYLHSLKVYCLSKSLHM